MAIEINNATFNAFVDFAKTQGAAWDKRTLLYMMERWSVAVA